ncbi:MAG: hypothetical protein IJ083_08090 [Clostridia bacterium]|nr:hypothetical protein [Clostridia bacterium]
MDKRKHDHRSMGEAYQQAARKVKRSRKVRSFLALASVFVMLVTSLSLMNQADTMEWEPVACALEEHVHTEDCYAWVTDHEETEDVTAEIRTLSCTFQPHVHTALCAVGGVDTACGLDTRVYHTHDALCYDADGNLVCTLPELREHTHTESCYETVQVLVCGQEESEDHTHTDACYETQKFLTCDYAQVHRHTEDCIRNGVYVCGFVEILRHQHTEACFTTETVVLEEGHHHTDRCYAKTLVCGKQEHIHTERCLVVQPDAGETQPDGTPETLKDADEEKSEENETSVTAEVPDEDDVGTELTQNDQDEPAGQVEEDENTEFRTQVKPDRTEEAPKAPVEQGDDNGTGLPVDDSLNAGEEVDDEEFQDIGFLDEMSDGEDDASPLQEEEQSAEPQAQEEPSKNAEESLDVPDEAADDDGTGLPMDESLEAGNDADSDELQDGGTLEQLTDEEDESSLLAEEGQNEPDSVSQAEEEQNTEPQAEPDGTSEEIPEEPDASGDDDGTGLPVDDALDAIEEADSEEQQEMASPDPEMDSEDEPSILPEDEQAADAAPEEAVSTPSDLDEPADEAQPEEPYSDGAEDLATSLDLATMTDIEDTLSEEPAEPAGDADELLLSTPTDLPEDGTGTPNRVLELGLASITAIGDELPEGASGTAVMLDGSEAEEAASLVEAFRTRASGLVMRARNRSSSSRVSSVQYKVLDISLHDVEQSAYEQGFQVDVRLPEAILGSDFRLFHVHNGEVSEIIAPDLQLDERRVSDEISLVSGFSFVTENFSQFVLSYTVDFEYVRDGQLYQFSLEGDGTIRLSELFEALQLTYVMRNEKTAEDGTETMEETDLRGASVIQAVDYPTFSDETLLHLYPEEESSDWIIESLQPFDTDELLIVHMLDGGEIVINVTDEQIRRTYISASGEAYEITVTYDEEAEIPEGSELEVFEVTEGSSVYGKSYEEYVEDTLNALAENEKMTFARFFDIKIMNDGQEIQPRKQVEVKVELADELNEDVKAVHFGDEVEVLDAVLVDAHELEGAVSFEADGFSVYGIVVTVLEKDVLASDGHNYKVTVTYGAETGIPEGAELEVEEILPGEDSDANTSSAYSMSYEEYVAYTENALGMTEGSAGYIRLFDIRIVDRMDHSIKYQPMAGTTVDVRIELADLENGKILSVVHFADGSAEGDHLESSTENMENGEAVTFEAESFSVYGIVGLDSADTAASVDELDGNSYFVSIMDGNNQYYYAEPLTLVSNAWKFQRTTVLDTATRFYFEKAAEPDDQGNSLYIYLLDEEGNRKYVNLHVENNNLRYFELGDNKETATRYTAEIHTEGIPVTFVIYHKEGAKEFYYWNRNGNYFEMAKSTNASVPKNGNDKLVLTKIGSDDRAPSDPYGLDGQSLGVLWNVNNTSGSAMMSTTGKTNAQITPSDGSAKVTESINVLKNKSTTVKIDPIGRTDRVFVAQNSDISMWTFTCCGPAEYYMTTVVNGQLKYVRFDDSQTEGTGDKGISLVDTPDERCRITVTEGTGSYSGKYKFSSNGRTLYNDNGNFFTKAETENGQNVWMYFAEQSNLNDDDFVVYTAKKVSVSGPVNPDGSIDYDVKNGDQVVLYTRIWNENTLEYEYYAIDYDGMLVRAYMSGDNISWVGSKVNTMLWDFTEYHYLDDDGNETAVPNYYYELQNNYSGKYIAPQVSGEGFLADSTVGINLNGRRYNEYYSTILAWDDPYYDYATLMADNYQLVSAPMSKAEDFYFAVMKPQTEETYLTTVATVDSEPFGITLKMQNYGNVGSNSRSQEQTDVLQNLTYNQWNGVKDLLTKYIAEGDSYPKSKLTGRSLSELYSNALTVNHQFLLSTYQETGYFEYDSTQNFAHLITREDDPWYDLDSPNGTPYGIGDFVIYNQIASTTESTGDTRKHGQFFPYNDLVENAVITNMVNDTDIHGNPLSSLDPSKGEKLYKLQYKSAANDDPQYVDFFFGMEMNASFMQSESGLDAWGHDLIFEFSGDDDFWLYIDDVLVLDLGGIHSALDGTVNFRTGKVIENNKASTLRERFQTAYKAQYPDKTQDEVNEWLNGIFKDDGSNTGTVFKDFSGHTMKMFYMERGAGASNLHMRFNLAPYVHGEAQLEKEVSGTDNVSAEFPFQIWYEDPVNHEMVQAGRSTDYDISVLDVQTRNPIRHEENYTTADGVMYKNVYFLSPGQTASVQLPSDTTQYYFVECGIDPATYDRVTANGDVLTGTAVEGTSGRLDYSITQDTVSGRKKVIFNNHVSDDAQKTLTVTKRLWREFEKTTEILSGDGSDADNTNFRFRVYIGEGKDKTVDGVGYAVYNTGKYYVKDPDGFYCIWQNGGFVSTGKKDFSQLSTEKAESEWKSQAEQATFYSSPGGAVDNIRAGYSIEIPGLMAGTPYYIEELETETPAGYNLIGYTTTEGAYPSDNIGTAANAGAITSDDVNRTVSVHNQHGYGLVVHKDWSDAAFMDSHDDIYFGVYLDGELVEGSVRQLQHPATSVNWFFPELADDKTLNDYQVFEIELTGDSIHVDPATDVVSGYSSVVKKVQDESIEIGGISNEHGYSVSYSYTVGYERETLTDEQIANKVNSRTDTVANARPGIKFVKTDLSGKPLEGAKFVLTDGEQVTKTFQSAEDGLIAVAYLESDKEYTLTETAAPYGYQTLISELKIKKRVEDGKTVVYVNGSTTGDKNSTYDVIQVDEPTATNMPTVFIRNKAYTLQAVKVDSYTGVGMANVQFALYKEVYETVDGIPDPAHPMPDYIPMSGYENLVTDAHGVIPKIVMKNSQNPGGLTAGTYYLREVETPAGYYSQDNDLRITISVTGDVTLQSATRPAQSGHWKFGNVSDSIASVAYNDDTGIMQITVKNTPKDMVRIKKLEMGTEKVLEGVSFDLYKISQITDGLPRPGEVPSVSGKTDEHGILLLGGLEENTTYYLYETEAHPGYNLLTAPVAITTAGMNTITAFLDKPLDCTKVKDDNGNDVWEITIYNSAGYELPSTGGPGTRLIYLLGGILAMAAGVMLVQRKKQSAV